MHVPEVTGRFSERCLASAHLSKIPADPSTQAKPGDQVYGTRRVQRLA